jgi:hypothetical protein
MPSVLDSSRASSQAPAATRAERASEDMAGWRSRGGAGAVQQAPSHGSGSSGAYELVLSGRRGEAW